MESYSCPINCENNYDLYHYPPEYTPWNYTTNEAIEAEILLNCETESNQYNYCEEMSERMTFYSKSQGTSSKKNCTENGKLTPELNSNDVESPPIKIQEFNENYCESDCKEFNIPNEIESSCRDFEVSCGSEFKASPFSEKSVISMNTKDSKCNIYCQDRSKGQVVSPSYCFNNKIQQIKRINTQNEFQTVDGSTNIKTIKYSDNNFTSRKDPSCIVHGILTDQNSIIESNFKLSSLRRVEEFKQIASPENEAILLSDKSSKHSMI